MHNNGKQNTIVILSNHNIKSSYLKATSVAWIANLIQLYSQVKLIKYGRTNIYKLKDTNYFHLIYNCST